MARVTFIIFIFYYSSIFGQINNIKVVDSLLSKWETFNEPGFSIGIIKDAQLIYCKGFGLANLEYDIPNSSSTVFRIASTSKQFTAACIILLSEQGHLNLDDAIYKYFPELPEYSKNITVRHLLNHTSGIRDYLTLAYLKGYKENNYYDDSDIMNWLVHQKELNFKPGNEYLYSNSGYWLLGQIVKRVTRINLDEFAQNEIFKPLGMLTTHFHNDHNQILKNRASGYLPKTNGDFRISMTNLDMIGDGGVFTTINDMKKWDDEYYNRRLFSHHFWNLMTTQGILTNGNQIAYASGLFVDTYKGLKTISHGGAFVGYRSEFMRFPEHKLSIILFSNRDDIYPTGICFQIADILLKKHIIHSNSKNSDNSKKKKETFISIKKEELTKITGHYWNDAGSYSRKIYIKNDTLRYARSKTNESSLMPINKNTFKMLNVNSDIFITFFKEEPDSHKMAFSVKGEPPFVSLKYIPKRYTRDELLQFAGTYYCEELNMYYKIKVENNSLMLYINDDMKFRFNEVMENFFANNRFGSIKFYSDSNNEIVEFKLARGRVKNLLFKQVK